MKEIAQMTDAQLQKELKRRKKEKETDRKAYKDMVGEAIPEIITDLKKVSNFLSEAKKRVFQDVNDLMSLKENAYDVKPSQKSHTFTTKGGDRLTIGYRVRDGWDDTVGSGVAKVSKFLQGLAKDEDSGKLVGMVNKLLKRDPTGNLNSNRVLELYKTAQKWENAEFIDGVKIIMDAYDPVPTVYFVEASEIDSVGNERNIPLSISTVDLPESATFEYFKNPKLRD